MSENMFDVLFRDFFNDDSFYAPIKKIHYPVDVFSNADGIYIDIVALGTKKENIEIEIQDGDILKVKCESTPLLDDNYVIHTKNIARRGFDFGWKIPTKYDLGKIDVKLEDGLLSITIPVKPESKPKTIKIK